VQSGKEELLEVVSVRITQKINDEKMLHFLVQDELKKYNAIHDMIRRQQYLVSRIAVKFLLGDTNLAVLNNQNGAPFIVGRNDINVSITHDNALVIVAISDKPVGIDFIHESNFNKLPRWFETNKNKVEKAVSWGAMECVFKLENPELRNVFSSDISKVEQVDSDTWAISFTGNRFGAFATKLKDGILAVSTHME